MENIKAILQAAGDSLRDIIQSCVYFVLMLLFWDFNYECAKYFDNGFLPERWWG
jgi:enamine deaminase RidA (YjgF/YER057c/UK114 family)